MRISLLDAGKRFNREWIFRHFNYQFLQGEQYAITGANGSGKSTLLQVIAGAMMQSEGEVKYEGVRMRIIDHQPPTTDHQNSKDLSGSGIQYPASSISYPVSDIRYQLITDPYKTISFAAPYLELIEEMTATEFLTFHSKFKPLMAGISGILEETGLINAASKQIRYFSSGMKQRLKLAQAFYSETPVLLLDEPTTNLDPEGITLYHSLINKYGTGKLVIISSNDQHEYTFCKAVIRVGDYK